MSSSAAVSGLDVPTLLIELAGPQQAWGSRSRFATRATELAPTKSGVVGLLAAALGMERAEPLDRFDGIRFGVRVDQPGSLERDFQTTRSLDGSNAFPLSQRYYLADAVFLAGVEAAHEELVAYRDALARPYFPLYLGRRAFPPSIPAIANGGLDGAVPTQLVDAPLAQALAEAPWRARRHHRRRFGTPEVALEAVLDAAAGDALGETRQDVPLSFDPRRRRHGARDVTITSFTVAHPDPPAQGTAGAPPASRPSDRRDELLGDPTDHDPEALLGDEEV